MIPNEESKAISIVRVLAMLSIVLCHFLQAYSNKWAWVFNIGVQIFLVLSGYLYGNKHVDKWGKWFLNRIVKLYVPLFIYTTIALTIIASLSDTPVSWINYLKMGGVDGLNHFWFMKAIGVCYLITPLLQFLKAWNNKVLLSTLIIAGILEYSYLNIQIFTFSYLWLYAMGYSFTGLPKGEKYDFLAILLLFTIILTCFSTWDKILNYDGAFNRSWHSILGLCLCLGGIFVFSKMKIQALPWLVKVLDDNAFYIYITHHIYLLGPLTLVPVITNTYLCIGLITVLILISTILLSLVGNFAIKKINSVIK